MFDKVRVQGEVQVDYVNNHAGDRCVFFYLFLIITKCQLIQKTMRESFSLFIKIPLRSFFIVSSRYDKQLTEENTKKLIFFALITLMKLTVTIS